MAPSSPAPSTPIAPSPAQAALAIAIIRSKPFNIAIRDHVLHLRRQIRRGKPANNEQEHCRYLDLVAYWKDECQRAQDECDRLCAINIKLERSNHLLSNLTSMIPNPSVDSASATSKRKAPSTVVVRVPKRAKVSLQKQGEQSAAGAQTTINNDFNFLDGMGEDGAKLTEALYTAHAYCRATNLDADALCSSLVQTASMLGRVICFAAHNYEALSRQGRKTVETVPLHQDKSDFVIALTVCARTFLSVLVGTSKMVGAGQDTRLPSLVVCELVEMFKTALRAIEASAHQTAHTVISEPAQSKKGKAKPLVDTVRESPSARALAHFLISLLGHLDKTDPTHQKIFDGFVYILLERVGKRLYYCTFGRHRSTNVENNIMSLPQPQAATDIAKQSTDTLAVRFEVKALILVLERAMGLAPHHMNAHSTKIAKTNRLGRTLSLKTLPTTSRARLSPIAKERLQRTLIACMYGETAHDEFLDVLTEPVPTMRLGSLQSMAKVDNKDVEEWYRKEVWRLVGWDVLAKENGW
ncbi:hypothetical protein P153DRAFT_296617 [Dothidotthia symphoricarpi CBS 119687]|uniref:Uncharacterized protein n=1 Tax=Dothidotthia symphoricarpi CBS 119687 TaxID=1392245 RepID=A0A6A6A5E4_9PLEO|nr:uncharacterized protein P153DRAFT_296617 [Dothidotthia symphoricarpi CBS 119687]KAF2127020.1 hypothetical protein P153DRAFT_296617 [Dothidotthia symphoricarpi CBS 119687]